MIDGLPVSFFFPLVVHALAGLTAVVTGVVAFSVPKGPARHHRWGKRYLWAYTVVFLTATILSVQRWAADAYLFGLAVLGYSFALSGYSARRFRQAPWLRHALGEYWVIAHLLGMIASYVVLWTAFYVDNAHLIPGLNRLPTLTFWVAPTLIALPFLVRSIRRFSQRRPLRPRLRQRHRRRPLVSTATAPLGRPKKRTYPAVPDGAAPSYEQEPGTREVLRCHFFCS